MEKMKKEIKNFSTRHKIQIILIVLAFALTIEIASISYIVYIKKHEKPLTVYETSTKFLTIYNTEVKPEEVTPPPEEPIEEKPIVIKKAPIDDKEDNEKKQNTEATPAKETTIEEAKSLYETDGTSIGIDVSKWNKTINWQEVAESGVEFAIIRCGYRGYGSGEIVMDPYFDKNIDEAIKNGIKVGVYFYSAAINEAEAIEEARFTTEVIKKYKITYPVVYDMEEFGSNARCGGKDKTTYTNNALAFLNYVKSKGYTPMMYANITDYKNHFDSSKFSNMKFWLANYATKTSYTGKYHMWQHSNNGSVPGISTAVDLNIAYFKFTDEAPAKQPVSQPEIATPENKEKITLTFKETNDTVRTISQADYFNDYNDTEKAGVIAANSVIYRKGISEDGSWSKVLFDGKEIYIKTASLTPETQN